MNLLEEEGRRADVSGQSDVSPGASEEALERLSDSPRNPQSPTFHVTLSDASTDEGAGDIPGNDEPVTPEPPAANSFGLALTAVIRFKGIVLEVVLDDLLGGAVHSLLPELEPLALSPLQAGYEKQR